MNSPPLLDPLPSGDRAVIGRSLAKVAEERFPSCREMVEALLHATANPLPAPPRRATPSLPPGDDAPKREATPVSLGVAKEQEDDLLSMETMVGLPAPRTGSRTPPREQAAESPAATFRPPTESIVRLRPTLFLGLGGLAGLTLGRLRRRLVERFGTLANVPVFKFLHIDTDRAGLRLSQQGLPNSELDPRDTLLTPLHRAEHYRGEAKELLRWLDRRWLYGIPRSLIPEGMRPLGRLALIDNASPVVDALLEAIQSIASPDAKTKLLQATGLSFAIRRRACLSLPELEGEPAPE